MSDKENDPFAGEPICIGPFGAAPSPASETPQIGGFASEDFHAANLKAAPLPTEGETPRPGTSQDTFTGKPFPSDGLTGTGPFDPSSAGTDTGFVSPASLLALEQRWRKEAKGTADQRFYNGGTVDTLRKCADELTRVREEVEKAQYIAQLEVEEARKYRLTPVGIQTPDPSLPSYNCDCLNADPVTGRPSDADDALYCERQCVLLDDVADLRAENERLAKELNDCPTCNGSGIMDVVVAVLPPDEREQTEPETCAECGGDGLSGYAQLRQSVERLTQERDEARECARRLLADADLARPSSHYAEFTMIASWREGK